MSTEERDEIVGYLKTIRSLLAWFGLGSFIALCSLITLIVADHYDLIHMKREVEWMRPKVEHLWYKAEHI